MMRDSVKLCDVENDEFPPPRPQTTMLRLECSQTGDFCTNADVPSQRPRFFQRAHSVGRSRRLQALGARQPGARRNRVAVGGAEVHCSGKERADTFELTLWFGICCESGWRCWNRRDTRCCRESQRTDARNCTTLRAEQDMRKAGTGVCMARSRGDAPAAASISAPDH